MILLGQGALERTDGAAILEAVRKITKNTPVLNKGTQSVNNLRNWMEWIQYFTQRSFQSWSIGSWSLI